MNVDKSSPAMSKPMLAEGGYAVDCAAAWNASVPPTSSRSRPRSPLISPSGENGGGSNLGRKQRFRGVGLSAGPSLSTSLPCTLCPRFKRREWSLCRRTGTLAFLTFPSTSLPLLRSDRAPPPWVPRVRVFVDPADKARYTHYTVVEWDADTISLTYVDAARSVTPFSVTVIHVEVLCAMGTSQMRQ